MTTKHGILIFTSVLKIALSKSIFYGQSSTGYFAQKRWLLFPFIKVIKERFFADTEGYLYQTTGSCPLQILMKPLRNAPNETFKC